MSTTCDCTVLIGLLMELEGIGEEIELILEDHPRLPRDVQVRLGAIRDGLAAVMEAHQEGEPA